MGYAKGVSGNKNGRPKLAEEEKRDRDEIKNLLRNFTPQAFRELKAIASDKRNKNQYNALRFIIDKAYGANAVFLEHDEIEPIKLIIERADQQKIYDMEDEDEWE